MPVSSNEKDILTEEEKNAILEIARSKKQADINLAEYSKKVHAERKERAVDPQKLYAWVMEKAKGIIDDFELSEQEKKIYWILCLYFTGHPDFEKEGYTQGDTFVPYSLKKGIWLFGGYGCGKTTILQLFQENPLHNFPIFHCRDIADDWSERKDSRLQFYTTLPSAAFNDLGTEIEDGPRYHFGTKKNVMRDIIEKAYDSNLQKRFKMHFTTNHPASMIEKYYGPRVKSRIRQMCNIISLKGIPDKRK